MGRAAERAEVAARTARVVEVQLDQDPGLAVLGSGGWGVGALGLLRSSQARPFPIEDPLGAPMADRLASELEVTTQVVASQLGALLQEAVTIREFLSVTTGRVLGRLARSRTDIAGQHVAVDDLDAVLVDLAALAGLATESIVRGPAWRFLDLGRRLERALAVLGSVEAALGLAVEPLCLQPLAEGVLAANESLVAYRRRHRSDVELDAVLDLLVHDDANPRSLAFQLDRMREHAAALTWSEGTELVEKASAALIGADGGQVSGGRRLGVDQMVLATRGPLLDLGAAVVARWFADPVDPHVMGRLVMRYRVRHVTTYRYSAAMVDGYTVTHLLPRATPWQQIVHADVVVSPEPDERDTRLDVFGNLVVQLGVHRPHDTLVVTGECDVDVSVPDLPSGHVSWEDAVAATAAVVGADALDVTPFVPSSPLVDVEAVRHDLAHLTAEVFTPGADLVEAVQGLCRAIYTGFVFDPTFTDVSTRSRACWRVGVVCVRTSPTWGSRVCGRGGWRRAMSAVTSRPSHRPGRRGSSEPTPRTPGCPSGCRGGAGSTSTRPTTRSRPSVT